MKQSNDWTYMPQMTPIVALAALFHDWGKANDAFQKKLEPKKSKNNARIGDVFRHEWISCRLIADLVASSGNTADDREWLRGLSERPTAKKPAPKTLDVSDKDTLGGLPPIASAVCWLIVSHHRLPGLHKEDAKIYIDTSVEASSEMLAEIKGCWGYAKESVVASVKFKSGTLEDSPVW